MSVIATAVKHLIAAGVTGDALVTAIAEMEACIAPVAVDVQAERRRAADRARKAAKREEIPQTSAESAETETKKKVPDKEIPHTPLEINLQEKSITAREGGERVSDQAFVEWNALASELDLPRAQFLTGERRQKLRARLAECGGLDGWRAALNKIRGSPHCRGENDRGWRANLDFVLQRKNFAKLMEGNYDERPAAGIRANSGSRAKNDDILDAIVAEARRRENGGSGGVLPEADPWAA